MPEIGHIEFTAGGLVKSQCDVPGLENLAHLRFNHVARQTIFGNAKVKHSAWNRRSFKDGDEISEECEIMSRRKAYWPAADNCDFVRQFLAGATDARVDRIL